ncbi:hypothetical protein PMI01_04365 [Caulobacter sp. AP07]|uniref:DUF4347 domain-containing protein n=1 Tax=Caulobacter sp. AP07 TaxID=1144304 RepID=UPI000271FD0B|nr:DUF4347 domain-containing protein [Caulobacter sp. AP07]EJL25461.1 hypothetical protein PMI01_04365 [Caulobacter sp. AP07]
MPAPTMFAPLPGCVTIDSTAPDGYLDSARAGSPNAGASSGTQTAASNLLSCAKGQSTARSASLVGHGDMGLIATGGGQSPAGPDQSIGLTNEAAWTPLLQPLQGAITDLYLYGVSVGAGDEGAQLLYDIAKVVGATVWAPTGLIYCRPDGDFMLESGAVWQCATPSQRPTPIQPPLPPRSLAVMAKARAKLSDGVANAFDATGGALDPKSAKALAAEVLWHRPFSPPGEPGGLITGRLRVGALGGARKSFVIYNHTLLRDEDRPARFYRATPRFRAIALGG